uniref:Mitochondrial carrier protein n=1 Tax=Anopheles maculatus TaxID=74869 RepID=A0A182SAR1_9DIPT
MDFLLGGCAATCAGFFSNPFDVIKTRQQLHGELLQRTGQTGPSPAGSPATGTNPYSSVIRSFRSILRSEGVLGLQKGLVSALAFQFAMNSVRLGIYQTAENCEWTRGDTQASTLLRSIAWGGMSGVVGSTIACPFYMVKTQIQARSHGKYAVGFQHRHTSTMDALTGIYRTYGIRGLWRGYPGIVTRTAIGSSAQLATFSTCKDLFAQFDWARESVAITAFAASMVSGFFTCVFMSPFDVIATRLFNQGNR